jgi:HAD superfamily phosphatase
VVHRILALFFKVDGVLVDASRSHRRAIEETVGHFTGRSLEATAIERYKNLGGFEDDRRLTHAIISDAGIRIAFGRIEEEYQRRYRGENWDGFIVEEQPLVTTRTLELLGRNGRVLGLVTDRPDAETIWLLDRHGWRSYFPLVVARERHGRRSDPDPFPLRHALAVLDAAGRTLKPDEVVAVGHTAEDMEAARSASMWAVGVVPPAAEPIAHEALLRRHGAHLVVASPDQLPPLIDAFNEALQAQAGATGDAP